MIGCIGAGKSTLARRIGEACRLPVVHLDQLWWEDGSYRITGYRTVAAHTMAGPAFRDLQQELAAADTWVIDGGYIPDLDTRLTRADIVVFLDLPRRVCLWRLLRRHNRPRPDYPDGVREGVGWLFILARWVWRYPSQKRLAIDSAIAGYCAAGTTVIRLRSRRQVTEFLRTLDRAGHTLTNADPQVRPTRRR